LLVGLPTIGCAKSVLVGEYGQPGAPPGSLSGLVQDGEVVGAAVRTREGAKPVLVSAGHRVSVRRAVETVLACSPMYRIPELVCRAHALVNRLRATAEASAL
jgi:deoxyribonuclease V